MTNEERFALAIHLIGELIDAWPNGHAMPVGRVDERYDAACVAVGG